MSATIWRCECGSKYEIPEAGLGSRVSCSHCGAVSRVEKPPSFNAPPPLPRARVPSREGSGKRPIAHGNSAAAVNTESKNPELFQPIIWAAVILGTGSFLLLLSVLVWLFRGSSTPQQQAENAQPSSVANEMENPRESLPIPDRSEGKGETDRPFPTPKELPKQAGTKNPLDVPSEMPTGKVLELADLAELVGPSVVQINVKGPDNAGTGSGFVLDKQGTIVTNFHVIEDATAGTIVFSDRTSAPITGYLGVWPEKDIALVKVECLPDKLHPIRLATSAPRQGERVAAFGSPLGLQQSVSEGIVSALRESEELRTLGPIDIKARLIQTTTPISKGNSGGPLVDMQGMVVGVNTLGLQILGGENLNFAVAMAELPPLLLVKHETPSPLPAIDPDGSVLRILRRAQAHFTEKDYGSAIADYTEAIRHDPKDSRLYSKRGLAYFLKQDYENAIANYTQAIRLNPKNAEAYYWRGINYDSKGDHDSAIADYTEAIHLNPKDASSFRNRGDAYRDKGDYDRAIADYDVAIRSNPTQSFSYYGRGECYRKKMDYDRAIADYNEAIRLDPKDAIYYSLRGYAHLLKGDYDSAIADYTEAIRLDPKDVNAYAARGSAYGITDDFDRAIADYTQAIRLDPKNAKAHYRRGMNYDSKGDHDSAIADYTEAIRLDPKNAKVYYWRGKAYALKQDSDNAIADFSRVIQLDPKNAEAYHDRGMAHQEKGSRTAAKKDFEQAAKLGYDPPDSKKAKRNPGKNDSKVAEKEVFPDRSKVRDRWKKIVIGMPYPQVEKLLGRPNDVSTFGNVGAIWTYRFDWTSSSGAVSFDENGRVKAWYEPSDWKLNE